MALFQDFHLHSSSKACLLQPPQTRCTNSHAHRQLPVVTHMMSTLAPRRHALQNASASCIRLDHDRATTANASQTAAIPAKCNCTLPRNRFEYQVSVALPTSCACCENSASCNVLEMPPQSFAILLIQSGRRYLQIALLPAACARQLRMRPMRRLQNARSRNAKCIRLGHDRMTTATATAD